MDVSSCATERRCSRATVGSSLVGCGVARAGAHRCDEGQPCGTAAYLYEERYLMHTFGHFCSVERRPLGRPTLRARQATSDPFLVFSHWTHGSKHLLGFTAYRWFSRRHRPIIGTRSQLVIHRLDYVNQNSRHSGNSTRQFERHY